MQVYTPHIPKTPSVKKDLPNLTLQKVSYICSPFLYSFGDTPITFLKILEK